MKKIHWRLLSNYQNYLISEFGEVMNRWTGKKIKPTLSKKGYLRVDLSYQKHLPVHKLVYETFIGKINKDLVIDHIDGNKINNHYTNLQQITSKENTRKGNRCKKIKLKDNDKNQVIIFETFSEMLRYVGYSDFYTTRTILSSKKFKNKEYEILDIWLGGDKNHA